MKRKLGRDKTGLSLVPHLEMTSQWTTSTTESGPLDFDVSGIASSSETWTDRPTDRPTSQINAHRSQNPFMNGQKRGGEQTSQH